MTIIRAVLYYFSEKDGDGCFSCFERTFDGTLLVALSNSHTLVEATPSPQGVQATRSLQNVQATPSLQGELHQVAVGLAAYPTTIMSADDPRGNPDKCLSPPRSV